MIGTELKQRLKENPELLVVLPQEHAELNLRMHELKARNLRAATIMGEAVEDGNAWHDNSGYDAGLAEMEQIDNISKVLGPMIATAEIVAPPTILELQATIGSRVVVNNGHAQFAVFLLGQNQFDLDHISLDSTGLEDAEMVSVRSPLGMAVLGSLAGGSVQYEVPGGTRMELAIEEVDQTKRLPPSPTNNITAAQEN